MSGAGRTRREWARLPDARAMPGLSGQAGAARQAGRRKCGGGVRCPDWCAEWFRAGRALRGAWLKRWAAVVICDLPDPFDAALSPAHATGLSKEIPGA